MNKEGERDPEILQELHKEKKRLNTLKNIAYSKLSGELVEIIGELGNTDMEILKQRVRDQGERLGEIGEIDTSILMIEKKIADFPKEN